jgi:hypothetical protein
MSRAPKADTLPVDGDAMTEKQLGMLMPLFLQAGVRSQQGRHDYAQNVIGRHIEKSTDMTKAEASKVIDALQQDIRDIPPEEDRV